MPAKSEKQARFFRLVRAVQKGNVSKSKVSPSLKKTAASISSKDASDFTRTEGIASVKPLDTDAQTILDWLKRQSGPRNVSTICNAMLWPINFVREKLEELKKRNLIKTDGLGIHSNTEVDVIEDMSTEKSVNEGENKFLSRKKRIEKILAKAARIGDIKKEDFYIIHDGERGDYSGEGPYTIENAIKIFEKKLRRDVTSYDIGNEYGNSDYIGNNNDFINVREKYYTIDEGENKFLKRKRYEKEILPILSRHGMSPTDSFYVISDYGWEDCSESGPYTLSQAISEYEKISGREMSDYAFDKTAIHYIGSHCDSTNVRYRQRDELSESVKLKDIVNEILKEDTSEASSVVKNIKAKVDDLESYLTKPENVGIPFSQTELQTIDSTDFKPSSKTPTQIKYSKTDEITNDNKELIIIKKQNRYLGYYSISNPVDLTPEENPDSNDIENLEGKEKSIVIIKVSKLIEQSKTEDVNLLTNFVTELVNEFQLI